MPAKPYRRNLHPTALQGRKRRVTHLLLALYGTSLLLCCLAASAQQAVSRTSAAAVLAESVAASDTATQTVFADTLLAVLIDAYQWELDQAAQERIRDPRRRARLYSWQTATLRLMGELSQARLQLSAGAPVEIHVDEQRQVLLFVEGRPIAFGASRPGGEGQLDAALVAQYCAYNDCAILAGLQLRGQPEAGVPSGTWSMREGLAPAFEIDGIVRCHFANLERRRHKQQVCAALVGELTELHDTLDRYRQRGTPIAWDLLRRGRGMLEQDAHLRIDAAGTVIDVSIPHLARLGDDDWARLIDWLQRRGERPADTLTLNDTDRLLDP